GELDDLRLYADRAERIAHNAKGAALLSGLKDALDRAEALGAKRKAVVFTESRRTQEYLFKLLSENGYEGQIVTLNGTNSDPKSRAIYNEWMKACRGKDLISGSKPADMKAALIDHFRHHAQILL